MADSESIAQFCAITGADAAQGEGYLKITGNNLEQAIGLYFEGGALNFDQQDPTIESASAAASSGPTDDAYEDVEEMARRLQEEEYASGIPQQDEVRERIAPVTERLVDPGFDYHSFSTGEANPFSSASNRLGIFNQRIPGGAPLRPWQTRDDDGDEDDDEDDDDPEFHDAMEDDSDEVVYGSRNGDDDEILEQSVGMSGLSNHQSRLANLFRPPFDLIRSLRLDSAKQEAIKEKKWVLINIQNSQEFQCQVLNRDLWSDKDVKEVVKSNFVFLQYPHDSSAGLEYSQYYPFTDYPHISILDPRTGEKLKVWNKPIRVTQWMIEVHDFLGKFSLEPGHRNPLASIPKQKKNVDHMTEEEQIELAMQQSLGQKEDDDDDDDDEVQIVEQPSSSSSSNLIANTVGTSSEPIIVDEEDWESLTDEEKFATILPTDIPEPTDPKTTTRVQIRLGTGQRIIRRFNLDDKVSQIFAVIKAIVPESKGHYFGLTTSDRRALVEKLTETISEAKLQNSAIMLEILD